MDPAPHIRLAIKLVADPGTKVILVLLLLSSLLFVYVCSEDDSDDDDHVECCYHQAPVSLCP